VPPERFPARRIAIAIAPERVREPSRDAATRRRPLRHHPRAARESVERVLVLRARQRADDAGAGETGFGAGPAQHVVLLAIVERRGDAEAASDALLHSGRVLV